MIYCVQGLYVLGTNDRSVPGLGAVPPGRFPLRLWYTVSRVSMYWGQTIGVSLDLEPSLQAGSLYAYGVIKVGRNAAAFLGNAADKRRMRTALGSVHGIMFPGPLCLRTNHAGSPWAWRNWLSAGALSRRFGVFKLTCRL